MDGLSSTEFAFVAALYLFSPNALQAQHGDFGQMLRAAAPGEARQRIIDADAGVRQHQDLDSAAQLALAAAARRQKLQAERDAYAAATAAWRQQRAGVRPAARQRPLVASSADATQ